MEDCSVYNIFDILPNNFFNIFNGDNKRIMSDCLLLAYDSFKNDLSFSSTKEQITFLIQDYFESHITTIEADEVLNTPRDKALYILRRLKECGWINEEVGDNYETYITFEDYAIKVMESLFNLDTYNDIEYSGIVYNIFISFSNFDVNKGDLVFETAYENTKDLANKLKNLNSNIKKYIQNLLSNAIKDDLEALLNSLLTEYQTKIVDRAYYNLTTYDNPSKYRQRIINNIENIIQNEKYVDIIVRNIMDKKGFEYQQSYDHLFNQSEYIINTFEHIEDIMEEIDNKNSKFIKSAINRITFLLNNQRDVEGKINNIIKAISEGYEITNTGNIYLNSNIDKQSLYIPRILAKPLDIQMEEIIELDEVIKQRALDKIKQSNYFSRKNIEELVMTRLETGSFLGSSLKINNNNELATLVLIYLYGHSFNSKYLIEPLDDIVVVNGYRFKDFKVRRQMNG